MSEKIEIEGYKEIFLFPLGNKKIILAENTDAEYRYMTGEYFNNGIFQGVENSFVSNEYIDIVEMFLNKCNDQLKWAKENIPSDMGLITMDDCLSLNRFNDISNKLVVLKPEILRREYQNSCSQLYLVNGGFGASANSIGRKVYVTNVHTGEKSYIYREDILGVIKPDKLPNWANDKLKELNKKDVSERSER